MDVSENVVAWRSIMTYQAVFALPVFLPVHDRPRMPSSLSFKQMRDDQHLLISIHQSASMTCQTMIPHCSSFEAPAEFHNPARAYCSRVNSCFQRPHFVHEVSNRAFSLPPLADRPLFVWQRCFIVARALSPGTLFEVLAPLVVAIPCFQSLTPFLCAGVCPPNPQWCQV
ncbi:hypothetical protein BJV82DRAFT_613051 [Fennellomyces sp. T-0311]|nr:hypothetical protein BJV82DRAFT_613051 [Fennellomyces sp. T-0311]